MLRRNKSRKFKYDNSQKRITLRPCIPRNKDTQDSLTEEGDLSTVPAYVVTVPSSLEELKQLANEKFEFSTQKLWNRYGGLIEDINLISDDDIIYASSDDFFTPPKLNLETHLLEQEVHQLRTRVRDLEELVMAAPPQQRRMQSMATEIEELDEEEEAEDDEEPRKSRLLVFVNPKSGGQQGSGLINKFRKYVKHDQIFDLTKIDPVSIFNKYRDEYLRVVACGGDGTVRWILDSIQAAECVSTPPVAILPLGTGNDLSRVLKWGGGYMPSDSIRLFVKQVKLAEERQLDRWRVTTKQLNPESLQVEEVAEVKQDVLGNYMGIGLDAQISLNFHNLREERPYLFNARVVNKLFYLNYGVQALMNSNPDLSNLISITVDGEPVTYPDRVEGLVIVNLPSYSGGTNLWGNYEQEGYEPQNIDDGVIEVVGIRTAAHLAGIEANINHALRLGQGHHIQVTFKDASHPVPMLIDGEPFLQDSPVQMDIELLGKVPMLKKRTSLYGLQKK
eukprot:gb/GECH01003129.1/.p1 GENE.gb/GECH01003129.1/~~gb/GECH01003129.1/.p1  ORF type:complete len:505 (+),score=94.00 gb/GECH01003129.1/:1-1515(+)